MKTHRFPAFLALMLAVLAPASAAIVTFVPDTPVNIMPGGTVTFHIQGQSVNSIGGFSLYLNSDAPDGRIQITAATLNTALFSYGGPGPAFPESISSTDISQDLGAFSDPALAANTSFLLTTITITIDAATPVGTYTIGNTAATVFTSNFVDADYAAVASFNINVVPEPCTMALLAAGAVGCLAALRGRRRLML
jgi:hypothetical protein